MVQIQCSTHTCSPVTKEKSVPVRVFLFVSYFSLVVMCKDRDGIQGTTKNGFFTAEMQKRGRVVIRSGLVPLDGVIYQ